MLLLAIDVGKRKSGLAIGNTLTGGARPLITVRGERDRQIADIARQVDQWLPQQIIVGLPKHMDGSVHKMTAYCRTFAHILQERINLPVVFADERLTTAVVSHYADSDSAAASVILQTWLDTQARKEKITCHSKQPTVSLIYSS